MKVCLASDDPKTKHLIVADGFCDWGFEPALVGHEVDPDTLGECTGLTDKNGKLVFEGDIVRQTFEKTIPSFAGSADLFGTDTGEVVILSSKGPCIKNPVTYREINGEVMETGVRAKMYKNVVCSRCEIIGTVYDNPELLKGGEG